MVTLGKLVMILDLARRGLIVSAIARRTGRDRKTIRACIERGLEPPACRPREPAPSPLAPFEPFLRERVGRFPAHDGTITTTAVDVMWGTDMTETITLREGRARVFVVVDHCSGECVGSHAARPGNRFEALEPVPQGVLRHFGAIERGVATGPALRRDRGSNFMAGHFHKQARFRGISPGCASVAGPQGNGAIERLFRILKEQAIHGRLFQTIDEVRDAVRDFAVHSDNQDERRRGQPRAVQRCCGRGG